ncbi:DUF2935 domain-containing protein [Pelosinus sp. IPA-1]|uniref:DUF2935 domain-containing protein n=1 Tax=Pelosinus sp. IPA-1 TaxID=3029569 RepID=UPI0024362549|nr:DUF2935 domain-containing protein [Pelosinus sp. IPA-1]GMA97954.1 hypothetical protein PIPA1_07540 [Pelosinus sp. IPA-1]
MDIFCREVKPYECLNLRRVQFWLRIMKEHALFMKLGFACSDTELIRQAEEFYNVFEDLEKKSCMIKCDEEFMDFVCRIMVAVKNIFAFKRHVLHLIIECEIGGYNYPLLIDHISREAMYFLKLLEKIKDGDMKCPVDSIVSDNVFWLRHMADHARFIVGLLDPSERGFVEQANDFAVKFEQLQLQARDLDSMLWHFRPNNDLVRFEMDATNATIQIRDFKKAARDLISCCKVVSLIPPLLADHVLREAEYFLEILDLIREDLQNLCEQPIVTCDY